MNSSLSIRLLLMAVVTTCLALIATAFVLNILFRTYFEERIRTELDTHLFMVTGHISVDHQGDVEVAQISDPRFSQPLSGHYWQVQVDEDPAMLSPSFWAAPFDITQPQNLGQVQYSIVKTGPEASVSAASWMVALGPETDRHKVVVTVATDRSDINVSMAGFFNNSVIWLAVLGAFLLLASWVQVRVGLRPLEKIRSEVARIMTTPKLRLSNRYPSEVQPLVTEVNSLLEANEASLAKARDHSGDLAHGLKTPLTVFQGIAHKLRTENRADIAADMDAEINNMWHIVERELALGRNRQSTPRYCEIAPRAKRLARMLGEQPDADHITWEIALEDGVVAPFDEHDLTELLGNLMDNAMKWTRDHIRVVAKQDRDHAFLRIEDNGPGIGQTDQPLALERGGRLSSSKHGSGLGLTIVRDMAEANGCHLKLKSSALGGLLVEVSWSRRSKEG